ncbi:hypothetical protein FHY15_002843 [Xanthomonas arboricola]|uniref:hypothetical protein n=1 Tax=Xanthomonas arboricola TaxID=56448 RepID=UPI0012DB5FD4|nr:hypothetical protein [Xanthomonas arboricola]NIK33681.1 hypothetical protein [Xanthomonas arboricola]
MDEEIDGSDILKLVRQELARLASSSPEAVLEVEVALERAIYDCEDDGESAGAIALAMLLDMAATFDMQDFRKVLGDLSESLSVRVEDVHYVSTGITGVDLLHLSKYLPENALPRMKPEDRQVANSFIEEVMRLSPYDPGSSPAPGPSSGPKPRRGPR